MRYVLIFWWSFYNNPSDTHSTIYPYTMSYDQCLQVGEKWLENRHADEIQQRHGYTCEIGNTTYEAQGRSPQRIG